MPHLASSPDLLSRLGHDLRSPLNAVLGFAQLLRLGPLPADHADAVDQIILAGSRLVGLVDELIDLLRLQAGDLTLSVEEVELVDVVRAAVDVVRPLADDVDVAVTAAGSVLGPGPRRVRTDRQRLVQILVHLVTNGVRYNRPGGHVMIEAEAMSGPEVMSGPGVAGGAEHVPARLRVSVRDDGPGIASADLARLFVPLDRLDVERHRVPGAGLGLPIAQELAVRLGSRIEVASTVGAGSAFSLELSVSAAPVVAVEPDDPVARPTDGAGAGAPTLATDDFEVLYVEDNLSTLQLVERMLRQRPGVRMMPAMQGRLGVELAVQRQPSLVLVDLHLPDLPGTEVIAQLRQHPATADIPIVVLTAGSTLEPAAEELRGDVQGYLTKPFRMAELLAVVDDLRSRALHGRHVGGTGTSRGADEPGSPVEPPEEPGRLPEEPGRLPEVPGW